MDVRDGGLGLPPRVCALLLEEIARGWASLASLAASHLIAVHALTISRRHADIAGALGRGELRAAASLAGRVEYRRDGDGIVLTGETALVEGTHGAGLLVVAARDATGPRTLVVVPATGRGVRVGPPPAVLGLRGAGTASIAFEDARVDPAGLLPPGAFERVYGFAHLAVAAVAVGVAQAAFEAALRYAQQRTAFGKPISQHQAIQLKLADMATTIAAARLLVGDGGDDPGRAIVAKLQAAATAMRVTLESMRIHGGYGYTTEFPVERYYRDAARLLHMPVPEGEARAIVAARLRSGDLD
jgi:alkylation response protein AidB-like acyl-CoA dehydrogenase